MIAEDFVLSDSERAEQRMALLAQFRDMVPNCQDNLTFHQNEPGIVLTTNVADGFWIRDKNIKGVHIRCPLRSAFNAIGGLDTSELLPDLQYAHYFNASDFCDFLDDSEDAHAPILIEMQSYYDYLSAYYNEATGKEVGQTLVRYTSPSGSSVEPSWHPDMVDITLAAPVHGKGAVYAAGVMNEDQIENLCEKNIIPDDIEVCTPQAGDILLFKGRNQGARPVTQCLIHKSSDCSERASLLISNECAA